MVPIRVTRCRQSGRGLPAYHGCGSPDCRVELGQGRRSLSAQAAAAVTAATVSTAGQGPIFFARGCDTPNAPKYTAPRIGRVHRPRVLRPLALGDEPADGEHDAAEGTDLGGAGDVVTADQRAGDDGGSGDAHAAASLRGSEGFRAG